MEAYVAYLCAHDVIASDFSHTGLHRTETLAEGGKKCDFRFKAGRNTEVKSTVWLQRG
jgi:hypothetical protein